MNESILVAYATRYGSTQEVAEAIVAVLREHGLAVDLQPAADVRSLEPYGGVVLGAALYMHHWHKDAIRFLSRHRGALAERPVAIFALGPVHDRSEANEWQNAGDQLDRELANFPWLTPVALDILGGKFDPAKLRFPLNKLAGKAPASDSRDWTSIRAWANELVASLQPALRE